ncbi:MAG TPA: DUF2127 domain-containing protein [Acidimicrobiales bacterium]|nr:DUF2127 domain-containing protein [Acidimicrobiales bacterium]
MRRGHHGGPGRERLGWWHVPETLVCGIRGHVVPASKAKQTAPDHAAIVTWTVDGRRLGRCLRCDAWLDAPIAQAELEVLPALEQLELPRRGEELREAVILRLIAVERAVHSVVFGVAAIGLWLLEADLPGLQSAARQLIRSATQTVAGPGQVASRDIITRQLTRLSNLHRHTLLVLTVTATIYAVVEGAEAIGLWLERRWAEYLTALATAGFLPFEVRELIRRLTFVRVGALVVNLAVLCWLVWRKHLFGIGHKQADRADPLEPYRAPAAT